MKTSSKILTAAVVVLFAGVFVVISYGRYFSSNTDAATISDVWQSVSHASKEVIGNGRVISKTKNLSEFNSVDVRGRFLVNIRQSQSPKVTVTIDANLLPKLNVAVVDKHLKIGAKPNLSLKPSKLAVATIDANNLKTINLSGNINVNAMHLKGDKLTLNMQGKSQGQVSANVQHFNINLGGNSDLRALKLNGDDVTLNIGGKGDVVLTGHVKKLTINTGGQANIDAKALIADNVVISGAGESKISVYAAKSLKVSAAGASYVSYYGNPKQVSKNGFGNIQLRKM